METFNLILIFLLGSASIWLLRHLISEMSKAQVTLSALSVRMNKLTKDQDLISHKLTLLSEISEDKLTALFHRSNSLNTSILKLQEKIDQLTPKKPIVKKTPKS